MPGIGIVGAGVAGLHLGLFLRHHGLAVTIYTDRGPDEIRAGRLLSTVALSGRTRERDREMGVNHWDAPENDGVGLDVYIKGEHTIYFRGSSEEPFLFIDMRLYLPRLLEDFAARGGKVVRAALDPDGVARISSEHDLMVIATGRAGLGEIFPRMPEHSPFTTPQRTLFAGLFRGIRKPDENYVAFQVLPGLGEIYEFRFLSLEGQVPGMLLEGVPGGPIDALTSRRYDDDPKRFTSDLYDIVQTYAPLTRDRIDRDEFEAIRLLDTMGGSITPVVRRHYVTLPNGRMAVALGDTHITHDPVAAQGANAASQAAWLFGDLLIERLQQGGALDEEFCTYTEQRLWEAIRPATLFSNAQLGLPRPHVVPLFVAAAKSRVVADAIISHMGKPEVFWQVLSSPEGVERFLAQYA